MKGWTEEEMGNTNLMAPCGPYYGVCGEPLFRGAQRCRVCKKSVADELDGSL